MERKENLLTFIIFVIINIVIVQTDNFSIGFLVNLSGVGKFIAGAAPYALDEINQRNDILNGHYLNFVPLNTNGHTMEGSIKEIKGMMEMKENGVVAFIGPDGRCDSESLIAATWNIPMLSYRCADFLSPSFQSQSSLIRTVPQVSKYIAAVANHYKWSKITLIIAQDIYWKSVADGLHTYNIENNHMFEIINTYILPFPYSFKNQGIFNSIKKSPKRSQVYIILGDNDILLDFIICMQKDNQLELADAILLSVDDEFYNPGEINQYILKGHETQSSIDRKKAFQSVMKLVPASPVNPLFSYFQSNVSLYSSKKPFKVPSHPLIKPYVPIYAAYLFDAIHIYAQALNETLQNNEDPRNGTAIIEKIRSRTFPSILGQTIQFDSNGDVESGYILLGFKSIKKKLSDVKIEPIATFSNNRTNVSELPILVFDSLSKWSFEKFSRNVTSYQECI